MSRVKKYDDAAKFITENAKCISEKPGKVVYQLNREPFTKFMTSRGLTNETIKQYNEAQNEYVNGAIVVAKEKLVEHKDENEIAIRTRMPDGRQDTVIKRESKARNPDTGKSFPRFGVVALRKRLKGQMDKDLLAEIAKEIEETV